MTRDAGNGYEDHYHLAQANNDTEAAGVLILSGCLSHAEAASALGALAADLHARVTRYGSYRDREGRELYIFQRAYHERCCAGCFAMGQIA